MTYTYDGDGNRVKKSNDTMYWGTGPLLESNGSGNLQREFIFADGKRIARRDISGGAVHYYFADNLGSTDVVATSAGTLENDSAYYPYGGERAYLTNLASQNYKFNGKERDSESGLDEFGARYYTNAVGRFMIPDWAAKPTTVPYANFGNPQSLNLYSYVQNNPTTLGDPDGHEIIYDPNLKNAQVVKDSVQAILANPHTSDNLSGYVGPNNPDLFIKNDDLSDHDSSKYSPDGTPGASITKGSTDPGGLQTTTSSSTDINGVTTTSAPEISGSATITIDNRTSKGDTPSVLVHESVHAGEARKDPAQFGKDAAAEKKTDPNCHDCRPQEQRANAAQKAYGNEINKAVKQIEKDRKNANK